MKKWKWNVNKNTFRVYNQRLTSQFKGSNQIAKTIMTFPIKQKSTKNLHFHSNIPQFQLKASHLFTESNSKTYSISLCMLLQKYDTKVNQNNQFSQKIKSMQTRYYDSSLIYMENQIEFYQSSQYLKRFYFQEEYQGKITMLGEYYKYHHDHPRIFLEQVEKVMTAYQKDQRQLEYNKVRQKIEEQRLANQQKLNMPAEQENQKLKTLNLKQNLIQNDNKKQKKTEFILQKILQKYAHDNQGDSENQGFIKKESRQKYMKRRTSSKPLAILQQKPLQKSSSSNIKSIYSHTQNHHKSRQTLKNSLKKTFKLKNAEINQIKNLQTKYTQILSQLFKKKRSSSKVSIFEHHKIDNLRSKVNEKMSKQEQVQKNSENKNQDSKNHCIEGIENKQNDENKKMLRSKSQASMNVCKSNKNLKAKLSVNPVHLITKPQNHHSVKQTHGETNNDNHLKQHALNKDNQSSNKSLKQMISRKPLKTVKVFQITKKDLIQEKSSKNNSLQKVKVKSQQKKSTCKNQKIENKENMPNENPSSNDQHKFTSLKPIFEQNSSKKIDSAKKTQKQPKTLTMFGRVLKTKIRG